MRIAIRQRRQPSRPLRADLIADLSPASSIRDEAGVPYALARATRPGFVMRSSPVGGRELVPIRAAKNLTM